MRSSSEKVIETGVLVIGGGLAGMFAAIKAKEHRLDVTLVDKAYAGKSGGTHFSEGDFTFFNPERGSKLDVWTKNVSKICEYLNNREWTEIVLKESYERYKDLVSWGIKFYKEGDEVYVNLGGVSGKELWENVSMVNREYAPALRRKALECGVNILDRIMVCELLKQDGMVVGAVGFNTNNGELHIFNAKVTVLAAGGNSLKAVGKPTHYWTSDSEAMAYRAGAEITGKEFKFGGGMALRSDVTVQKQRSKPTESVWKEVDTWARFPSFRGDGMALKRPPTLNAEGGPVISAPWEAHCGRAPVYVDIDNFTQEQMEWIQYYFRRVGTAEPDKVGLDISKRGKVILSAGGIYVSNSIHGGAGIWPVDTSCATSIPGLYVAGECCGTVASGASYAGFGFGLCHAAVTGNRAGLGAAEYALKSKEITIDEAELTRLKNTIRAPLERKGGFSPRWITQVLQGFMVPYFVMQVKHGERLQAVLTLVQFLNNHLIPKVKAKDAHEWRMAQEIKNMALNSEMILRASLYRTESRGTHFREDYPRRDDPNWLAWVKLRDGQGEMKLAKEPIPKEWWPDLSEPYEERYPHMFPGE